MKRGVVAVAAIGLGVMAIAEPAMAASAPSTLTVNVYVTNQTSNPVNIGYVANNVKQCATETWQWPGGSTTNGQSILQPGQSGTIQISAATCPQDGNYPVPNGADAFTIGIVGYSQFVLMAAMGGGDSSSLIWQPQGNPVNDGFTGAGNSGGMYMYNCGNGQLFGGTNANTSRGSQPGSNYNYGNDSAMCFTVQSGAFNSSQALSG